MSPRTKIALPGITALRAALMAAGAVMVMSSGCASAPKPIFETKHPALGWPERPHAQRIKYVGELRSAADLKPARSPFRALGDMLVGRKKDQVLYGPRAVLSLAGEGTVWIADPGGRCLHLFDLRQRKYTRIVNVGDAPLLSPVGLCRGKGNTIYVCDAENAAVYHLDGSTGALISELRLPDEVLRPVAVLLDEAADELFVVDAAAHDIKVLAPGGALKRIIGRRGGAPGEFNFPLAIAADGDLLWVVDTGNYRIQSLKRDGTPVSVFGQAGDAPGDLALPKGIAVDSDGQVYVVDARFENVQVFDESGRLLLFFGEEGRGPGEFWLPAGIDIDDQDRIWVCDLYNSRIQVFDYLREAATGSESDVD